MESVCLRKCLYCLYDHQLTNKAYLSAITVTDISECLPIRWRQKSTGIDVDYVTVVTLCIKLFENENENRLFGMAAMHAGFT